MSVSERDRRRMKALARASRALEQESRPPSDEHRRELFRLVNPGRVRDGLPPLEDDDVDPPELGFFRRARALGMLRHHH